MERKGHEHKLLVQYNIKLAPSALRNMLEKCMKLIMFKQQNNGNKNLREKSPIFS
jgi:hypothetical protein